VSEETFPIKAEVRAALHAEYLFKPTALTE